uniref:Uncharacterized protein n=1 Tax=Anopheles albimanus TaxID=7167 RepID=A0A182FIZ1_ANOAL
MSYTELESGYHSLKQASDGASGCGDGSSGGGGGGGDSGSSGHAGGPGGGAIQTRPGFYVGDEDH